VENISTKKPSEAAIRDYLAEHLDIIEPGLTLVDKEFYLRNPRGASGFLDIFARAPNGQLVIIEIKRTNSAAREAIQELHKYAALLRERYLIKEIEYRLILLSVEWSDLLAAYSEFTRTAPYEIWAGRIVLGENGLPIHIERVEPIAVAAARRIAVRHFLWRFPDVAAAKQAVSPIAKFMQAAGLRDFVLIESQSNNPAIADKGFLYFAQQELRFDEYMTLIERNLTEAQIEEFRESIAELSEEEDRIAEAADAVWLTRSSAPYRDVGSDDAEISHPEKARCWFDAGAQAWVHVHRFGRFDDERITDEMIIDEIVGEGGESDYRLRITAQTDSPPQMSALAERVENIFFFNSDWRGAVRDLINYAERTGPATVDLVAFSNDDILRSIAAAAFGYPGYLPMLRLDIRRRDSMERFIGLPEWDGTATNFDRIIGAYFEGDRFGYFITAHFGENRGMNHDIMNDLGLHYRVYREGETGPERVRVQGSRIIVDSRPIRGSVSTMIGENVDEVHKIVALFMEHDTGFGRTIQDFLNSDWQVAERKMEAAVKAEARPTDVTYWMGEIDMCNRCGHPFAPLRFMVDAILANGAGANLCAKCFFEVGTGLGTGRGQLYEATKKGWLHIAG
jgi:Endonuclease NucS